MKKSLSDILENRNIKPSYQRIKVLEYFTANKNHPTAEQIYRALQNEVPPLSKATVYNTLNIFLKNGIIKLITIDNHEKRYDINTEDHGHFKCEICGKISDFQITIADFDAEELNGFKINDKNVYFKGICPRCSKESRHEAIV